MIFNSDSFIEIISKILLVDEKEVIQGFNMKENEEWDSMTHLVLISDLESTFNISFTDEEVVDMTSIMQIRQILKKHAINVD